MATPDTLKLGTHELTSRLFVGTGKYATLELMQQSLEASGTQMVTVAVRRIDFKNPDANILNFIDTDRYLLLPNTAFCYTAKDAIRTAMLAREAGLSDLIKLEVLGDEKTLLPDPIATLEATALLVKEGFTVLTYTSDDPIMAQRLEQAGATAVMPAGSPIGGGLGILNPNNIRIILENASVPIIVDAGVGTASDVAFAMELGCEGVLLNSGIALASDPVRMAHAMRHGCEGGRLAYRAGRIPKKQYAKASSPTDGLITASD